MDEDDTEQGGKDSKMKNLPAIQQSAQFDLFSSFYGEGKKHSNTIELWDAIPKFSCSRQKQNVLRDNNGRLPTWEREFLYKPHGDSDGVPAKMVLNPARVKVKGEEKEFLPSADEELIEEVLRKIFTDQHYGRHYTQTADSYVDFTLGMIYRELKVWGHTRSLDQIKLSLNIMTGCHMTLQFVGNGRKAAYKGSIIPEIMEVGRTDYIADPKARWRAKLPSIYSHAINSLEFRQFNYATLMSMSSQLSKWLQKLLARRYTNASLTQPFNINYSTIKRDSSMLIHSRENRNKVTVIEALDELIAQDVVNWYKVGATENDPHEPKYELTPTGAFVAEVKAANKRQSDNAKKLPPEKRPVSYIGKVVEMSK